jgi:hypothetical protein
VPAGTAEDVVRAAPASLSSGIARGAHTTGHVPGIYLPCTCGVPGRRNPQASGELDLCPRPGAPGPWPGCWGRAIW